MMAQPTVDQILLQVRALERKGDVAAAGRLCRQALARYPANTRLRAALEVLDARRSPSATGLGHLSRRFNAGAYAEVLAGAATLARQEPRSAAAQNLLGAAAARLGRIADAIAAFERALALDPRHLEAATNLAAVCRQARAWDKAAMALERALALKPDQPVLRASLAEIEMQRLRPDAAIAEYQAALALDPGRIELLIGLARAQVEAGLAESARSTLLDALAQGPGTVGLQITLAHVEQMRGDTAAAEAAYRAALAANPALAPAWRGLSQVHRFTPGDPVIAEIETLHARPDLPAADRIDLAFALAKAREDLGEIQTAFDLLVRANAARKVLSGYTIAQDRSLFAALGQTAPALARAAARPGPPAVPRPIFILGMPRSGTTLVEQILSSHPDVAGGGELPYLGHFGLDLATGRTPATPAALAALRRAYLTAVAPRAGGRGHLTDKMPHNFRLVALIRAALPEARIVHVHRDPAATCWSNFRTYFTSEALGYTYDLADTAAFYRLYADLMRLWRQMDGTALIEVDYDRLTAAPEAETRRLLAALDLPWDDACLAPEANTRSVRTASQHQIRAGIRAGSSEGWRRYAPFLGNAFADLPDAV